jgi:signal transduction histidine kinase
VLKVNTSSEAEFGVIEVWDNGIGISEEAKEKIFIPFFTTKDPGEGTGLGLSVSRKIVEENGGTIDFESRQGDHTRFVLKFPLVDPG